MATIVHFDIAADDPERAKKFYEVLFGWKIEAIEGFPDYYEIQTEDLAGKPGIGGGITKRSGPEQNGITNFIGVDSIDSTIGKLNALGGKVIQQKQAIPGYGYLVIAIDTENNLIGLFEEAGNAQ